MHWRTKTNYPSAASPGSGNTTAVEYESLVAVYGQINHLIRKYKHLRTCNLRNTQALTRSLRRLLDQPCHPSSIYPTVNATATSNPSSTSSSSSPPPGRSNQLSEGWKVTNAADAVMLLRSLPHDELERLVLAIDHSSQPSHSRSPPLSDQSTVDFTVDGNN